MYTMTQFRWHVPNSGFLWKICGDVWRRGDDVIHDPSLGWPPDWPRPTPDDLLLSSVELHPAWHYSSGYENPNQVFEFLDAVLGTIGQSLWPDSRVPYWQCPVGTVFMNLSAAFVLESAAIRELLKNKATDRTIHDLTGKTRDLKSHLREIDPTDDHNTKRFDAFNVENNCLFLTFASTPPNARGLLEFANKFGRLGKIALVRTQGYDNYGLYRWYFELMEMRWAVRIWNLLKENTDKATKKKALGAYFKWHPHPRIPEKRCLSFVTDPEAGYEKCSEFPEPSIRMIIAEEKSTEWTQLSNENDPITAAQWFLKETINWHMKNHANAHVSWIEREKKAKPRKRSLVEPKNKNLGFAMEPTDLLGALWVQFGQVVIGDKEPHICQICGRPFVPSRSDHYYHTGACKTKALRRREEQAKEWWRKKMSKEWILNQLKEMKPETLDGLIRKWEKESRNSDLQHERNNHGTKTKGTRRGLD